MFRITPSEALSLMKQKHPENTGYDSIFLEPGETPKFRKKDKGTPIIDGQLILPLFNNPIMPFQEALIEVSDAPRKDIIKAAIEGTESIALVYVAKECPDNVDELAIDDLVGRYGVLATINDTSMAPNGTLHVLLSICNQGIVKSIDPDSQLLCGDFEIQAIKKIEHKDISQDATTDYITELYEQATDYLTDESRNALYQKLDQLPKLSEKRFHFMVQNSPLNEEGMYSLFQYTDYDERRQAFIRELQKGMRLVEYRHEFNSMAMGELGQRQKDEMLRTQIRMMQNELGEGDESEEAQLEQRAAAKEWSEETAKAFKKELARLRRYAPNTPDYAVQFAYLDTFLELPWRHCDHPLYSIEDVRRKLDEDHYGLEKVKERIVEHCAVLKLRDDMKAPILCLYGPPGVGKTSLGKSVAEAMGRKYMRVSLGGVHDEAEIRGHRRTYLGSMPGRIITAIQKCGTSDPVLVLDEIDKLGADIKGDPSSALLEVLDPEQNCKFHDNYIDHDYDLSHVLFIATANDLSTISGPLLDRMEIIEIGGYVEDEKIEIALRYLIPKNLELHGFGRDEMSFTREALHEIIDHYTRESGVRRLEKKIATIIRKQACLKADGKEFPKEVGTDLVKEYLGRQEVFPDQYENNDIAGVVTGLAWTSAGGEILFIESSVTEGKESKLTLTGNLGDVMKESAVLALEYLKSHAEKFGLDAEKIDKSHVHIHVPEGAVPKDGPSAGITIATSLASAFSRRKVKEKIAMTGEITLRGKVLPVGGIKEKILAAKRAGINEIILSDKNRRDIEEIKPEYIEGMEFHFVSTVAEVLELALLDEFAE